MLYGPKNPDQQAELAGSPAYANQFQANGLSTANGNAPWINGEQDGSHQVLPSAESGREGPLNIFWRGQKPYEEARVGRVFNLRRPERYPVAVLDAESVNEGVLKPLSCMLVFSSHITVHSRPWSQVGCRKRTEDSDSKWWSFLGSIVVGRDSSDTFYDFSTAIADRCYATYSVRNKSLLIDLGNLKELSYDSVTRIVTVSPSTTGGELNPYLARWGRFFGGGQ